ncbi:MAG: helix-turn-helix transcriptional regulator [Holdemanella sp.]|nr:helix-turn-helix transcriptional regulator [Holdemanella sp.]
MTNTIELEIALKRNKKTYQELANEIGISYQSLSLKANNKREFKAGEIMRIQKELNLTSHERDSIFFENKVD